MEVWVIQVFLQKPRLTIPILLIQQAKLPHKEAFYENDENDLNGNHAAKAIGYPPEQVYKTLVTKGERSGIHVFCIPVCCELDLKKAAKAAGDKDMALVPVKDLLTLQRKLTVNL
jgi:Cys-tRNA(Pro)/Cys-tRNA(Cys) deacylase